MALLLPNSVFIHVPRTGGQWFRTCIANWEIEKPETEYERKEIGYHHCSRIDLVDIKNRLSFGFVRHPWTWIKSRWSHIKKKKENYTPTENKYDQYFHECYANSFETTLENVCTKHPSLATHTFEHMLLKCDFIGRMEDNPKSASMLTRLCGEHIKPGYFSTPKLNTSTNDFSSEDYRIPKDLKDKYLRFETTILDKFYHASLPPTFIWIR